MASARQFSVTLPPGVAEFVEAKIKSGACDGVQALLDRDDALEKWLREEVVAGYHEYLADPSKGVPVEELRGMPRLACRKYRQKITIILILQSKLYCTKFVHILIAHFGPKSSRFSIASASIVPRRPKPALRRVFFCLI
ncbi:hypothetical protein [Methylosinus sp. Sm6]|uniref:ribbon-helix-helix domain-containing protein n=1 Tax=Methylosinus sp. Sm6 TaxID=2866948 RepID=UPI001C9A1FBC|nr:hypothetical protein [Methylosinus sp. Sm6]MBY6241294.1 hypothetical protein [Methylosinus sp. Sm6]